MPNGSPSSLLIDTNVLIYAADAAAGVKALQASAVVQQIVVAGRAVITAQVISEFYSSTTRPKGRPTPILTPAEAVRWVDEWFANSRFLQVTQEMSRDAVRGAWQHSINIYDALIWASARLSGIRIVLTEDLPGSRTALEGVHYVNPFAESFELADIGL